MQFGLTANPSLGFCTDLLVRSGATVLASRTTEIHDGIDQLMILAGTPAKVNMLVRRMAWHDAYLAQGGTNVHVFATEYGTRSSLAAVPVLKVATRSDLTRCWHDLMDVDIEWVADRQASSRTWDESCSA
jgi:altronate dehydratase